MKRVKMRLKGAPGWHIECSAMACKYLGDEFDIHTGGIDHIPVHHTNEIAQAEAAGKRFAHYWLHGEFLVLKDNEKMAKSDDNFLTLAVLQERGYDPLDYRYLCLSAHYRKPLTFSWEALDTARSAYASLKNKMLLVRDVTDTGELAVRESYKKRFLDVITDDLNMPQALALLWEVLGDEKLGGKDKYELALLFDSVLGLNLGKVGEESIPEEVMEIVKQREAARQQRDWTKADELRGKVSALGYEIRDTPQGPVVRPK